MSQDRAYRKGAKAQAEGLPRSACPYPDHRKCADPKRPMPLRKFWLAGYDESANANS